MEKRKIAKILIAAVLATVFVAAGLFASSTADVIKMENPAYAKHKKGVVMFTHTKHYKDYGAGCGECHHDKDGKALDGLKEGDAVDSCIACHKIASEMPKAEKKALKGKSKAEKKAAKMVYHAEAIHDNCKGCHKAWNKKNGKKGKDGAPTSCATCHPKAPK